MHGHAASPTLGQSDDFPTLNRGSTGTGIPTVTQKNGGKIMATTKTEADLYTVEVYDEYGNLYFFDKFDDYLDAVRSFEAQVKYLLNISPIPVGALVELYCNGDLDPVMSEEIL